VDQPQPEIRIGDRERREVDDRLRAALDDGVLTLTEYDERAALCWAARTRSDLDALIRDLPPPHPPQQATEVRPAPAPVAGRPVRRRLTGGLVGAAVLGVALLFGVPALGAADGMSLFGSRQITVGDQSEVEVGVLFGSVDIVVPDGVRARTAGTVVFGSIDCDAACSAAPPTAREVVIDGGGAFGSIDVVTASERERDHQEDIREDREDERDDD
jgi:hypothetical protein